MEYRILVAWLEALRSADYNQCQDRLRSEHKFSALGVLADCLVKAGCGHWRFTRGGWHWEYQGSSYSSCLPLKRWWWPRWGVEHNEIVLLANDRYGKTLEQIADLVEDLSKTEELKAPRWKPQETADPAAAEAVVAAETASGSRVESDAST